MQYAMHCVKHCVMPYVKHYVMPYAKHHEMHYVMHHVMQVDSFGALPYFAGGQHVAPRNAGSAELREARSFHSAFHSALHGS